VSDTPTVQAEILRLLHDIGPLTVAELELCLPRCTRAQLVSGMGRLRANDRVFILSGKGLRNPLYALGADPERGQADETNEARQERLYRERMNPHLAQDWRPAPDHACAWLFNPTQLEQELPCHVD
jgi:hypothetical protein